MKNKLSEQIGIRLRAARRAAKYRSAREFALKQGISQSTYSQHETGKRSLTPELLCRYAKLLGVSPNWLLTGDASSSEDEAGKHKPMPPVVR
jgi:transcriptional regulator with XRE-family HTH domain